MANYKFEILLLILAAAQVTQATVIDFSKDIKLLKHLQVHNCRQKCFAETLDKTNGNLMNFGTCQGIPDCYMCFDYCEVLPKAAVDLAQAMCADKVYCSKGCRIACTYHRILGSNNLIYEIIKQ